MIAAAPPSVSAIRTYGSDDRTYAFNAHLRESLAAKDAAAALSAAITAIVGIHSAWCERSSIGGVPGNGRTIASTNQAVMKMTTPAASSAAMRVRGGPSGSG